MHYKNGRPAKNGDKVLFLGQWNSPVVGILFDATAGNDTCNGNLAVIAPGNVTPNLAECLHIDDVKSALSGAVPDISAAPAQENESAPPSTEQ